MLTSSGESLKFAIKQLGARFRRYPKPSPTSSAEQLRASKVELLSRPAELLKALPRWSSI
jgi:hypothetical protein